MAWLRAKRTAKSQLLATRDGLPPVRIDGNRGGGGGEAKLPTATPTYATSPPMGDGSAWPDANNALLAGIAEESKSHLSARRIAASKAADALVESLDWKGYGEYAGVDFEKGTISRAAHLGVVTNATEADICSKHISVRNFGKL